VNGESQDVTAQIVHPGGVDAYLGVDLSAGKWAGVLLAARQDVCVVAEDIESLVAKASAVQKPVAIAIDIPIQPPVSGVRPADTAIRKVLRGRGSALFTTPVLAALEAPDYATAVQLNKEAQGLGLSKQAFALARGIVDVHRWLARGGMPGVAVFECHPELSFAHMVNPRNPAPVEFGKKSWEGMRRRIRMLHGAGIDIQYIRDELGQVAADDLIDASAAAWTARRYATGIAVRYPPDPDSPEQATIWA